MSLLLRLERKQKNSPNPFRIRIFLFLSYSIGIETINTFIHSRVSLENHARCLTKMGKIYTRFRPKRRIIPTRWGGTYLYDLYKGVPRPPPPPPGPEQSSKVSILYSPIIVFKKQCHKLRPWLLFFISVAIALQLQITFRSIC